MTPEQLIARILFQDANLIILDKPAGLAVHGGPKTPHHLEAMLGSLRFGLAQPPRPAHRLDRDTAGCLLLARHDKAARRLGRLFSAGLIEKCYWAVVQGEVPGDDGVIDLALAKVSTARDGWRMVPDAAGQRARTRWRRLGAARGLSWLELEPETGRTHQIRVHCAAGLGCPILGDPVYGRGEGLLHLQSHRIGVPYWADRPPITAQAPSPPHMDAALRLCGAREAASAADWPIEGPAATTERKRRREAEDSQVGQSPTPGA